MGEPVDIEELFKRPKYSERKYANRYGLEALDYIYGSDLKYEDKLKIARETFGLSRGRLAVIYGQWLVHTGRKQPKVK